MFHSRPLYSEVFCDVKISSFLTLAGNALPVCFLALTKFLGEIGVTSYVLVIEPDLGHGLPHPFGVRDIGPIYLIDDPVLTTE